MVVAGSGETTVDLIRDMMHVLTSCCARLHDRRVARHRARSAVTCASSRLVPVLPAASRNAETDGGLRRFVIPEGWVAGGCRFEVEPTTRHQRSAIGQHFGARRFAYNWALARVKANLDARTADPTVPALAWSLPAIHRDWNQAKHQVAPWWRSAPRRPTPVGLPIWSRPYTTGRFQARPPPLGTAGRVPSLQDPPP